MSGRDQSANLGGMLTNIGNTIGSMGDAYKPVMEVMEKANAPKYDPNNPDSIKNYQQYLISKGEHGIASQLNHVWEAANGKQAKARVDGLATTDQKISNINAGIAANGQNPAALAALTEALQLADQERKSSQALIDSDPYAQELLTERKDEALQRQRNQLAVKRDELALQTAQATKAEQDISNGLASAFLTGQVNIADYDPEAPEEFFKANPMMQQAATKHPEAFEDAIDRVRETQETAAEIQAEENATREYTAEDITGEDGLNLPATVAKQYDGIMKQLGVTAANDFLAKQTTKVYGERIKTETESVNTVYNTGTVGLYQRAVQGDIEAMMLADGKVGNGGFLWLQDVVKYPEATKKLQVLMKDEDTRKAVASQVVADMMSDKAPQDPETRERYLRKAIEKFTGPAQEAPAEDTDTETDSRGRKTTKAAQGTRANPYVMTEAEAEKLPAGSFVTINGQTFEVGE